MESAATPAAKLSGPEPKVEQQPASRFRLAGKADHGSNVLDVALRRDRPRLLGRARRARVRRLRSLHVVRVRLLDVHGDSDVARARDELEVGPGARNAEPDVFFVLARHFSGQSVFDDARALPAAARVADAHAAAVRGSLTRALELLQQRPAPSSVFTPASRNATRVNVSWRSGLRPRRAEAAARERSARPSSARAIPPLGPDRRERVQHAGWAAEPGLALLRGRGRWRAASRHRADRRNGVVASAASSSRTIARRSPDETRPSRSSSSPKITSRAERAACTKTTSRELVASWRDRAGST